MLAIVFGSLLAWSDSCKTMWHTKQINSPMDCCHVQSKEHMHPEVSLGHKIQQRQSSEARAASLWKAGRKCLPFGNSVYLFESQSLMRPYELYPTDCLQPTTALPLHPLWLQDPFLCLKHTQYTGSWDTLAPTDDVSDAATGTCYDCTVVLWTMWSMSVADSFVMWQLTGVHGSCLQVLLCCRHTITGQLADLHIYCANCVQLTVASKVEALHLKGSKLWLDQCSWPVYHVISCFAAGRACWHSNGL